jgi:hypothetical protein
MALLCVNSAASLGLLLRRGLLCGESHICRSCIGIGQAATVISEAHPMNAYSVFSDLLRPRPDRGKSAAHLLDETEELDRLPPTLDADDMPAGFEDVLEVQVLGYRERLTTVQGRRRRVLEPVWTLVPKGR